VRRTAAVLSALLLTLAACGGDGDDATDAAPVDDIDGTSAEPSDDELDATSADPSDDVPGTSADPAEDGDYDVADQPEDAAASFVTPTDGDTVSSPFEVEVAADGAEVVPAGEPAVGEAHLHVIVDAGCVEPAEVVPGPSDDATADGYNHYGDGATGGELELEPGTYELCTQLADGVHQAYGQTETITITVE
jgi:hypothetical protein